MSSSDIPASRSAQRMARTAPSPVGSGAATGVNTARAPRKKGRGVFWGGVVEAAGEGGRGGDPADGVVANGGLDPARQHDVDHAAPDQLGGFADGLGARGAGRDDGRQR